MRQQLEALYNLQAVDIQISKINERLAAIGGANDLKRALIAARSTRDAAKQELTSTEIELKDSELKLKSLDERRTVYERRLYGSNVSNPKELSNIEKEIYMIKDQQSELDQRTLELYEAVEQIKEKVKELEERAIKIERTLRKTLKDSAENKAALETEMSQLQEQREQALAKVTNKALLAKYDSIRKHTGQTAVAKVVGYMCEGCHTALPSMITRNLLQNNNIEICENCGRILMLGDL